MAADAHEPNPALGDKTTREAFSCPQQLGDLGCVAEALPTDWWTTRDVAAYLNVTPSTIRSYVARGQMPGADRRIGREPVWRPATIRKWHSQRPRLARDAAEQPR